jgi:hypothetical protein
MNGAFWVSADAPCGAPAIKTAVNTVVPSIGSATSLLSLLVTVVFIVDPS